MKLLKNKEQFVKIWIIILIVTVFCFHPTFADSACSSEPVNETLEKIRTFIWYFWRLASWIWIILSNFAWVLMTNKMVYWEFMWLDSFLWKIWQLSRNLANYALWFIFIYSIFKYIFYPKEKPPVETIKQILFSSVLIQASWFLVMVLVDFSTIALATVSSFPSQVLSSSTTVEFAVQAEIRKNDLLKYSINSEWDNLVVINAFSDDPNNVNKEKWWETTTRDSQSEKITEQQIIDSLMPSTNNLWWPFMFLGFTVLNAQDYTLGTLSNWENCTDEIVKLFISLILGAWINILYSLALAILIVILIMRLIYIRLFIALIPIIILLYTTWLIDKVDRKITESVSIIDLKKWIKLIFQPVIFGIWISLMFLFIIMLQNFFNTKYWTSLGNLKVEETRSTSTTTSKTNSSIRNIWGVVNFTIKEWARSTKDILLSLIVLVFMWQFIKIALSSDTWVSSLNKITSDVTKNLSTIFGSAWVIPTPAGNIGLKQVRDVDRWRSELLDGWTAIKSGNMEKRRNEQIKWLKKLLGVDWNTIDSLRTDQVRQIKATLSNNQKDPDAFVKKVQSIRAEIEGLIFGEMKQYLVDWIQKCKEWKVPTSTMNRYFSDWNTIQGYKLEEWKTEEYLKTVFDEDLKNQKTNIYKTVLWWTWNPQNYEGLESKFSNIK